MKKIGRIQISECRSCLRIEEECKCGDFKRNLRQCGDCLRVIGTQECITCSRSGPKAAARGMIIKLLSDTIVSISELKTNPTKVFNKIDNDAAVLNHNKVVGYIVSIEAMEAIVQISKIVKKEQEK